MTTMPPAFNPPPAPRSYSTGVRTQRARCWVQNYNVTGSLRQRKQRSPKMRIISFGFATVETIPIAQGSFVRKWVEHVQTEMADMPPASRKEFKQRVLERKLAQRLLAKPVTP